MDWRAWTSGGIAGISLSIMGHPFDTIKTRMQTNPNHRSALACAVTMARREGVLSLWQGLTPSIVANQLPYKKLNFPCGMPSEDQSDDDDGYWM